MHRGVDSIQVYSWICVFTRKTWRGLISPLADLPLCTARTWRLRQDCKLLSNEGSPAICFLLLMSQIIEWLHKINLFSYISGNQKFVGRALFFLEVLERIYFLSFPIFEWLPTSFAHDPITTHIPCSRPHINMEPLGPWLRLLTFLPPFLCQDF